MDQLIRRIDTEIAAAGGKKSRSRARIIEVFFAAGGHVTVDDLTRAVRRKNRGVGAATVYRTLKLLAKLGYADELDFGESARRYESALADRHGHLVCRACGAVSEFRDKRIETLQKGVARRHGFRRATHRFAIYGTCRSCAGAEAGAEGAPG